MRGGVPAWWWLGKFMTLDRMFYSLLVKQELLAASVTSRFTSLIVTFLKEAFIRMRIIVHWINYTIIIAICMHNNNAVITNNYGRLQDIILLFRILMGTWKNVFKIYRQYGHAPLKKFASSVLHNMYPHSLILSLNSCHICVICYFLFYFLETTWNSFGYSCLSTSPFVTSIFKSLPLRPWTSMLCCCGYSSLV
jgi:hypothetical protein